MPADSAPAQAPDVETLARAHFKDLTEAELELLRAATEGEHLVAIRVLSLGGGLASGEHQIPLGTAARIRIQSGIRSFGAKIVVRDSRSEQLAFDIADMDLDDRRKLRSLLMGIQRRTA